MAETLYQDILTVSKGNTNFVQNTLITNIQNSSHFHWKCNDNKGSSVVINDYGVNGVLEFNSSGTPSTQNFTADGKIHRALDIGSVRVDCGNQYFTSPQGAYSLWFKADVATHTTNRYIFSRDWSGGNVGDTGIRIRESGDPTYPNKIDAWVTDASGNGGSAVSNVGLSQYHIIGESLPKTKAVVLDLII